MHHRKITCWLAKISISNQLDIWISSNPALGNSAWTLGISIHFTNNIKFIFVVLFLAASLEQSINSNNTGSQLILTDEEELVLFGGQGTVFTSSDGKVDKKKTTLSEPTKSGKNWTPHKINPIFDILEAYIVSMRLLHVN